MEAVSDQTARTREAISSSFVMMWWVMEWDGVAMGSIAPVSCVNSARIIAREGVGAAEVENIDGQSKVIVGKINQLCRMSGSRP